jgi:predicted nucleic acid-binding protein
MILIDSSILVAWDDPSHPDHVPCTAALVAALGEDECAISAVTYAELAVRRRTREHVDELLSRFTRIDLTFDDAWRAGLAFSQFPKTKDQPVLPDFFIRAQAAARGWPHLTNDRRRRSVFPDVEFIFPGAD